MRCDVLVVGGGAVGLAAARASARRGASVVLVDPLPLLNEANASNDESKFFRVAYGDDAGYARMALDALPLWRALERETGRALLHHPGLLLLARAGPSFAAASERTLRRIGAPVERIEREELRRRASAFSPGRFDFGVVDLASALLDARPALEAFAESARAAGARIVRGRSVATLSEAGATVLAALDDGTEVTASRVVVAAGGRTPRLVPALGGAVTVTRQVEIFLAPNDPRAFDASHFPLWAAFEDGFYGFPAWRGAVKIADHRTGPVADPDALAPATPDDERNAREFLRGAVPDLASAPVARTRVCPYDMTATTDFVLGPVSERVVVACGFSGHGVKFAPLLGDWLAAMAAGEDVPVEARRFAPSA